MIGRARHTAASSLSSLAPGVYTHTSTHTSAHACVHPTQRARHVHVQRTILRAIQWGSTRRRLKAAQAPCSPTSLRLDAADVETIDNLRVRRQTHELTFGALRRARKLDARVTVCGQRRNGCTCRVALSGPNRRQRGLE